MCVCEAAAVARAHVRAREVKVSLCKCLFPLLLTTITEKTRVVFEEGSTRLSAAAISAAEACPAKEEGIVLMRILRNNASQRKKKEARQPRMLLRPCPLRGEAGEKNSEGTRTIGAPTEKKIPASYGARVFLFSGWPCPRETWCNQQDVMPIGRGELANGFQKLTRELVHGALETARDVVVFRNVLPL